MADGDQGYKRGHDEADVALPPQEVSLLYINRSKKETPHSFKGQQLENKSLYRFVIYMSF